MKTAMYKNQVVILDKCDTSAKNLCSVANQIRHISKCDTKTAYAEAKILIANADKQATPKKHGRGVYVRDAAWKAKKSEQMKSYWQNTYDGNSHGRGVYVRDAAWKAKKAEQMKTYWESRRK